MPKKYEVITNFLDAYIGTYLRVTAFLIYFYAFIGLHKETRTCEAYVALERTVKNMLTSLKAVSELQNPAIRERHWLQLMKTTKVKYGVSNS